MKGPSGRLRYQVRRVWECPRCRRREWTAGQVVHQWCACSDSPVGMKLIEELPHHRVPRMVRDATEEASVPGDDHSA
jgi:hypothetical protein